MAVTIAKGTLRSQVTAMAVAMGMTKGRRDTRKRFNRAAHSKRLGVRIVIGGRVGVRIMIWGKGGRGIRRGRAGKMATAVSVLRGVAAIHGTSRVAIHGTSRVAAIFGTGRVVAAIHGTSKIVGAVHGAFRARSGVGLN